MTTQQKDELLHEEFLKIQEKHIDWFKNRSSVKEKEPHDMLHNHWVIRDNSLCFHKNTELPKYIVDECVEVTNRINEMD